MSSAQTIANAVDPDWKWLYRVGGVCALLFGLAYIVVSGLRFFDVAKLEHVRLFSIFRTPFWGSREAVEPPSQDEMEDDE
jgi:hypothetical protein